MSKYREEFIKYWDEYRCLENAYYQERDYAEWLEFRLDSAESRLDAMRWAPDIENIAELCHSQWSGWMAYLFSKCWKDEIGAGQYIPITYVERWIRQMNTPYSELTDAEKESDRAEARKFISLFIPIPPLESEEKR